jgi:hypothetical protein
MGMAPWNKRRVSELQSTIENARINANHAASVALAIWEEWESVKKLTQEERDSMIGSLTDAKIQIEIALEELES